MAEHERRTSSAGELERSLGFLSALTIGIGTMVGAGIFVFPGVAAGSAGPAAMVSFAIGAVIALLVALPASELATAMPESGGAYYFVSRSLGAFTGTLVGLVQWMGLIFASAFYLVGFAYYLVDVLKGLFHWEVSAVVIIACVTALALTVLSITGTRNTGNLQNGIVVALLVLLGVFFTYGILNAFGVLGPPRLPERFAPFGYGAVLETAALVFTSYLGFVQIANVAGEIRKPARNLPRAMIGSVLVVGTLYVVTMFVSTSVFGSERLSRVGETALVEVARVLMGPVGGALILGGGLLATLSSANASILSSSRSVYALGRDRLVPPGLSRVSDRFATPVRSLVATGVPIALLTLLGRVELLAEVASVLHLLIYGLLCLALIALRRRDPDWYRPSFRMPGYPWVPVLGAVSSFGLIAFVQRESFYVSVGVLVAAACWFGLYGRGTVLESPSSSNDEDR